MEKAGIFSYLMKFQSQYWKEVDESEAFMIHIPSIQKIYNNIRNVHRRIFDIVICLTRFVFLYDQKRVYQRYTLIYLFPNVFTRQTSDMNPFWNKWINIWRIWWYDVRYILVCIMNVVNTYKFPLGKRYVGEWEEKGLLKDRV